MVDGNGRSNQVCSTRVNLTELSSEYPSRPVKVNRPTKQAMLETKRSQNKQITLQSMMQERNTHKIDLVIAVGQNCSMLRVRVGVSN